MRPEHLWCVGYSGWPRCGGRGQTHPRRCEDVSSGRFSRPDFPDTRRPEVEASSLLPRKPTSGYRERTPPPSLGLVRTRTAAPRCASLPVGPPLAATPPIGGLVHAPHLVGGAARRRRSARSRPQRGAHLITRRAVLPPAGRSGSRWLGTDSRACEPRCRQGARRDQPTVGPPGGRQPLSMPVWCCRCSLAGHFR